ncbi:MAG: hypothetical protein ACW99G_03665 [Candidatus Thorarchaeota archaeon]
MNSNFRNWLYNEEKKKMNGGAGGAAATGGVSGSGTGGVTGGTSTSTGDGGGGTDTGDISHHHYGIGWGYCSNCKSQHEKGKCKKGRRKDGKCRKRIKEFKELLEALNQFGYNKRVRLGKKKESEIMDYLRTQGYDVEEASSFEDINKNIDGYIEGGEFSKKTSMQIKFRETSNDIRYEVVRIFNPENPMIPQYKMNPGKDAKGSLEKPPAPDVYTVLDNNVLHIVPTSHLRSIISQSMREADRVFQKLIADGNPGTFVGNSELDTSNGVKFRKSLNRDRNFINMVAFIPTHLFEGVSIKIPYKKAA